VLLVGMLVMARGLVHLQEVSPGFTPDHAISLQLSLPSATYGNRKALTRFYESLHDRVLAIPGVESAGAVSLLPLSGLLSTADIAFPDRPAPPPDEVPQAHLRVATAGYFAAAGIDVFDGRAFTDSDRSDSQPVAVVSRTFATRHWPHENAVGKMVQLVQSGPSPLIQVVGVVNDVKQFSLDTPATADLYVPIHQMPAFQAPLLAARMNWIVRGRDDAATVKAVRAAVEQIDPVVAASSARTLESLWLSSLAPRRAHVLLLQAFSSVSVLLCTIGVYGVAAFAARARRRELAIRAAIGATRRELAIAMLRRELRPVLFGLGLGITTALIASPVLFADAFEVSWRDPAIYLQVGLTLLVVAAGATYLPVRRASDADPIHALSE
jgi:predicted permease